MAQGARRARACLVHRVLHVPNSNRSGAREFGHALRVERRVTAAPRLRLIRRRAPRDSVSNAQEARLVAALCAQMQKQVAY